MIKVDQLKKHYGAVTALAGISFEVPKGQVLGFLGPNGAGKTTTMKILTGFLLPDGGRAEVAGMDVVADSLEVRRRIGYLPETTPLYAEMRVDDYLRFTASARGVPAHRRAPAIQKVVESCGLRGVVKKGISELSKGYRQRVGLAQAMVHEPDLLILDEPTSGLDPIQIIEIRELIKRLGTERTVILSTHYLQEVEATCGRVIIIARGRIVADGTIEALTASEGDGQLRVRIVGPADQVRTQLEEVFGPQQVKLVSSNGAHSFHLQVGRGEHSEEAIFDLASKNRWKLLELHRPPATLETVFLSKTRGGGGDA